MAFSFSWDTCLCSSRLSPNFINFVGKKREDTGNEAEQICRQFIKIPRVKIMLLPQLDIFKDINYLLLDEIAQGSQEQEMEKVQNKIPQIFT